MSLRAFAVCALLVAGPSLAQDDQGGLGLDLSGSPSSSSAGMGLDLSEPTVPAEFRPSLAIIGVKPKVERPEDEPILKARASGLDNALVNIASGESFSRVMRPEEVKEALGADFAAAADCNTVSCLDKVAQKLDVDRVAVGQLVFENGETKVSLYGYDTGKPSLVTTAAESNERAMKRQLSGFAGIAGKSQQQKDREFLQHANGSVMELVNGLKTPLGTLSVRSYEPDVDVQLNGRKIGTGTFSQNVAAGEYALHAESASVLPYDTKVVIESQKVAEVALSLTARPDAHRQSAANENVESGPPGTPLYKRPGMYVALAGAVLLGVGAVLGSSAKSVEKKAADTDGDGVLNITRAQMQSAKTNALLANVLVGAGGAALVGGGVWMFVAPGTTAAAPRKPDEPEGAGGGFTVGVGGSF